MGELSDAGLVASSALISYSSRSLRTLPQELPSPTSTPKPNTTMPSSDYTAAAGGALKLKGFSGIDKKKKKKKPKPSELSTSENPTATADPSTSTELSRPESNPTSELSRAKSSSATPRRSLSPDSAEREIRAAGGRQKTEAEKRHEEMRRKRLEDRLKREGVKTHKEKVEELNKYLSGLSEHHDMPKIGPG